MSDQDDQALCPACDDTGWVSHSCLGWDCAICGRRKLHLAHDFAVPCSCRPINRHYQDRVQAQRKAS